MPPLTSDDALALSKSYRDLSVAIGDFRFKNWNPGEPNNHNGGESFINTYEKGTWNDTTTSDLLKGFIVEFDKGRQAACRKRG